MTTMSTLHPGGTKTSLNHDEPPDDISTTTEHAGQQTGRKKNRFEMRTLRFRFERSRDPSKVTNITAIHTQWMLAVLQEHGDDVRIFGNTKYQRILDYDPVKWNDPNYHKQFFETKSQYMTHRKDGIKHRIEVTYIIHKVQTRVSFNDLKNTTKAINILKDNKCYLEEHYWELKDVSLQQLGFIVGVNPQYYERRKATDLFKEHLQKANGRNPPKFELIQVKQKAYWNDQMATTKSYSVQVRESDAEKLAKMISKAMEKTPGNFIPYKLRRVDPEAFFLAIKQHNFRMLNQHNIVVKNLNLRTLFYLETHIRALPGVQDVVEARNNEWTGRVNVLVDQKFFRATREELAHKLEEWIINYVPQDAKPIEGQFSGDPEVSIPKGGYFSSGENSLVTTSAVSVRSIDEDISAVTNENRSEYSHTSYLIHSEVPVTNAWYQGAPLSDKLSIPSELNIRHKTNPTLESPRTSETPDSRAHTYATAAMSEVTGDTQHHQLSEEFQKLIRTQSLQIQRLTKSLEDIQVWSKQKQEEWEKEKHQYQQTWEKQQREQQREREYLQREREKDREQYQLDRERNQIELQQLMSMMQSVITGSRITASSSTDIEAIRKRDIAEVGLTDMAHDKRVDTKWTPQKPKRLEYLHLEDPETTERRHYETSAKESGVRDLKDLPRTEFDDFQSQSSEQQGFSPTYHE
jgi:hypothetical protein